MLVMFIHKETLFYGNHRFCMCSPWMLSYIGSEAFDLSSSSFQTDCAGLLESTSIYFQR